MGGGHHHLPKIPDYKIYKIDAPELIQVQDALKRQGLSDPWLRNEAWRYSKDLPRHGKLLFRTLFRGFPVGVAALVVTLGIEQAFDIKWHDPLGHHAAHEAHAAAHGEHH